MKSDKDKLHFYMIAGNVMMQNGDMVQSIPVNGMITADTKNLGQHQLAKAQQILQMNLAKKLEDAVEAPNFVDVIIISIMHLGYMTMDEFTNRPQGVSVQEKVSPAPAPKTGEVIDFDAEFRRG